MSVTNPKARGSDDVSVKSSALELKDLVVAYAKQETVDPLRSLLRYLGWGLAGSALLAVGTVFGAVTAVRVVQSETGSHLRGDWSWVPYGGGVVFVLAVVALAVTRIVKSK